MYGVCLIQVTVYKSVQHCALIYTVKLYLYSQAKFRHISVVATTKVTDDNTTDPKTAQGSFESVVL
jgi:hypothetical protein